MYVFRKRRPDIRERETEKTAAGKMERRERTIEEGVIKRIFGGIPFLPYTGNSVMQSLPMGPPEV